jgi:hypothetical protein
MSSINAQASVVSASEIAAMRAARLAPTDALRSA